MVKKIKAAWLYQAHFFSLTGQLAWGTGQKQQIDGRGWKYTYKVCGWHQAGWPARTLAGGVKFPSSLHRSEGCSRTDKMSFGRDLGKKKTQHPCKLRNNWATDGSGKAHSINRNHQCILLGRDQRLFLADLINPDDMIRKIAMQWHNYSQKHDA